MFDSSIKTLEQFKQILLELPEGSYAKPCEELSNATIGQHSRHVIELYECLIKGYDAAMVSYDKRERNHRIENDVAYAVERIVYVQDQLARPNKAIKVSYELNGNEVVLDSNYDREVMYNLEHAIHHHALIKIGIKQFCSIELPESFGVAPSTMQYRKVCAQ